MKSLKRSQELIVHPTEWRLLRSLLLLVIGLILVGSPRLGATELRPNVTEGKFDPRLGPPFVPRDRLVLGSEKASIVVLEVANFKCGHCGWFHEQVFPRLREQYISTGKVQWMLIFASGDQAQQYNPIFSVARCANRQGKLWDVMDYLFKIADRPPSSIVDLMAKSQAVDRDDLGFCVQDRTVRYLIAGDFSEAASLKIEGTPTFFIRKLRANGEMIEAKIDRAQDLAYFQRVFDKLLQEP